MTFECKDLERALEVPELMRDAREHARNCRQCSHELWVWSEMSQVAAGLREEWDSPGLWPKIRAEMAAEPRQHPPRRIWRWAALTGLAAMLAGAAFLWKLHLPVVRPATPTAAFLTERALQELEQSEAAYVQSIEKLSRLTQPQLPAMPSPLAAAYRDKLQLLDTEIVELRASIAQNRFNTRLRMELASLYREKQETLKEMVQREQRN